MNRPFQIALAIGFVGLVIATAEGVQRHGFHTGTIAFVAVFIGIYSGIFKRVNRGDWASKHETTDTEKRLIEMENRLTDLQDIVISIDDKLGRMADRTTKPTNRSSDIV
jgi:hypothetical protein